MCTTATSIRCSACRSPAAKARGSPSSRAAISPARASPCAIIAMAAPPGRAPPAAVPCMPNARRSVVATRLLVLLLIAAALSAFFASGAYRYLTFEHLKAEQARVDAWYRAHPGATAAAIATPRQILSPALIGAFVLLGIFPLLAKKALDAIKARRVYARWPRPRRFDRNLIVIGGGSAGLVSAYIAAAVRAKVTLVEKDRMGGDCLNTGCVPSKALIKSARVLSQMRRAADFGLRAPAVEFSFAEVMERVQRVVRTVEPHDSAGRYTQPGVGCIQGDARNTCAWRVGIQR